MKGNKFTLSCNNSSELRKMDRCLLSNEIGPVNGECLEATILEIGAKYVRISISSKLEFVPKYLDAYSSETAFERNYSAIYEIINNDKLQKIKVYFYPTKLLKIMYQRLLKVLKIYILIKNKQYSWLWDLKTFCLFRDLRHWYGFNNCTYY